MMVLIITGGELGDIDYIKEYIKRNSLNWDLIICVDGGVRHVESLGVFPDLLVGDFDSIDRCLLEKYREMGIEIRTYPKEKDWTDTQIAVDIAIERDAHDVYIIGGLGNRWDHSYANIMLLYRLGLRGINAKILHSNNTIEMSKDNLEIQGVIGQTLSLLPFSQDVLIESTQGLAYPLKNAVLTLDYPLGISNIFTEERAIIKVAKGWIIAIISKD